MFWDSNMIQPPFAKKIIFDNIVVHIVLFGLTMYILSENKNPWMNDINQQHSSIALHKFFVSFCDALIFFICV
jgi:hypothetical protein